MSICGSCDSRKLAHGVARKHAASRSSVWYMAHVVVPDPLAALTKHAITCVCSEGVHLSKAAAVVAALP